MINKQVNSSFRDSSGFIFKHNEKIFRQINKCYQKEYEHLLQSGLYNTLITQNLLISHTETELELEDNNFYKIIKPQQVPLISYSYEWSFSQLKAAAIATLDIQLFALKYGMTLKDASAYNIQFIDNNPIFIDSLSFDLYQEGQHWIAYKQFCQHFLAPLTLMAKVDINLNQLLKANLDGIPLQLASKILPRWTKLSLGLLFHIHIHSKSQKKYENINTSHYNRKIPKQALISLIQNLKSTILKLKWIPKNTQWADYYAFTNYTDNAFNHKKLIIQEYLKHSKPNIVWDLGGNIGEFSRIAAEQDILTYCLDIDPAAVEKNYHLILKNQEKNLMPLLMDFTNPTPSLGWANEEWSSLTQRGPVDMCMALALIHHLALGNNLPFHHIASYFSKICKNLIIEFIPKTDSQVIKLMQNRKEIRSSYNLEDFENAFNKHFNIQEKTPIAESERTLYLMSNKQLN